MKVIAYYLPQFHSIPENDEWWGTGFTEWYNVRKAEKLFEGHYQPRKPLNDFYYNLLEECTLKWQVDLAKKYSVYGFCIYHYWFEGKLLLEKPLEMMKDSSVEFPYCICWANESWTNAWKMDGNTKVLIEQTYGEKDEWKRHFDYLLPFFKDKNYIKENDKPLFVIYRPELINNLNEMLDYFQILAKENHLKGLSFAYQQLSFDIDNQKDDSRFSLNIEYQPGYARYDIQKNEKKFWNRKFNYIKHKVRYLIYQTDNLFKTNYLTHFRRNKLIVENYEELSESIVNRIPKDIKAVPGAFVGWDNTPRRGNKGRVCIGSTPALFYEQLKKQIYRAKNLYKKDMIFVFAWNEWAEGGYLEPDEKFGYGYLEAVKKAIDDNDIK